MGKRGPAKKQAAAKKRSGTYRKDRDAGVELPAAVPNCPDWLGPEGTAEFQRRAPQLAKAGLLAEVDQITFGLWCQAYEQLVRSLKQIEENGHEYTTETDKGNLIQHPVVAVLHKARGDLLKIGREFGMTPAARSGLSLGSDESDDDALGQLEATRIGFRSPKRGK